MVMARGVVLNSKESRLYKRAMECRKERKYWYEEEIRATDALIVLLYRRLSYAVEKCASLLEMSKHQITKDIRRLESVGRLIRKG